MNGALGYIGDDIKRQMGIPHLRIEASSAQIQAQTTGDTRVSFEEALAGALKSFLEDGTDTESPLATIHDLPENFDLPKDADASAESARLRELMNDAENSLVLLDAGESIERGETTDDNWIFQLKMPQSFSSLNWAVVDKSGVKPPYNYGFD